MTPISTDLRRSDEHRSTWLIRAGETVGEKFSNGHFGPHYAQFRGASNPQLTCPEAVSATCSSRIRPQNGAAGDGSPAGLIFGAIESPIEGLGPTILRKSALSAARRRKNSFLTNPIRAKSYSAKPITLINISPGRQGGRKFLVGNKLASMKTVCHLWIRYCFTLLLQRPKWRVDENNSS